MKNVANFSMLLLPYYTIMRIWYCDMIWYCNIFFVHIILICWIFLHWIFSSPNLPTGPIRPSSRDVHGYMYIYVPFSCQLVQGLSSALRSHDQFHASIGRPSFPTLLSPPPSTNLFHIFVYAPVFWEWCFFIFFTGNVELIQYEHHHRWKYCIEAISIF